MDLIYGYKCVIKLLIFNILIRKCETVSLTSNSSIVEENDSVVFRCSYRSNVSVILVQWFRNDKQVGSWYTVGQNFNSSEYIHDISAGLSTLTKITVTTNDHNTWWRCDVTFQSPEQSDSLYIFVNVPVSKVFLKLDGNSTTRVLMAENVGTTFTCKSSASYPVSNITWFKTLSGNNNIQDIQLSQNTTVNVSDEDESGYLVSVIGRLTYFPTTSDNGSRIYCKASNINGRFVTSNETTNLYVQYSPTLPTFSMKQSDVSGTITIIKRNILHITCNSSGDPAPSLIWAHASTTLSYNQTLNIPSVNETNAGNYTCKAENVLTLTNLTELKRDTKNTLSVKVLVPPAKPKLYFGNTDDGNELSTYSLNVIQNRSFTVKCTSTGIPTPACRWGETGNSILTVVFADKDSYRTCSSSSLLTETVGENKTYSRNATLSVNVLYPPDVLPFGNQEAVESGFFRITCSHKPGNPIETFFKWTSDFMSIFTEELFIQNVSKLHDRYYNCTAYNKMQPTVGRQENGSSTKAFHLTVLYKATVDKFVIEDREYASPAIVNETESVRFSCHFESNPSPNITLNFKENTLKRVSLSKILDYNHTFRSCLDAGEYTCSGENKYNNKMPSIKTLAVKVKCTPLSSIKLPLLLKIASRRNVSKTLNFTAVAYPEPGPGGFTWHKFVNDTCLQLANDSDYRIVSSVLDSNLTIRNVSLSRYGMYKLVIRNSFGKMEQNYTLVPEDKPDKPINFMYVEDSISDSSVLLKWEPAFNGGYPQTFILTYSKTTEYKWQNRNVSDSGTVQINFTLSGLSSMTRYEVQMYANNKIGNSTATNSLRFTTKAAPIRTPIDSHSSAKIGIVAGSVSSAIVIVTIVGIIVVILIYRKRNNKETGRVYQNVPISGNHNTIQRKQESRQNEETAFEGLQEVDDVPIITNERTEYCNSPDIIDKIDRIKVAELFSYVSSRSQESFEADYQKLPTELQKPCTFARKPENIALNRYNGIYPYDHSRVKLPWQPDFFINACYIDGYNRSKAYIASLGPTAKTTYDFTTFWKMIWYEKVDVIVMLTNLREPSGMKCEKYWPEGSDSIWYGDVCVSIEATECFAEYTIRNFSVSKEDERRYLSHLHYTAWPDKTVPEDVTSLIEFRQRMKITPTSSDGPVVVHCSAGIGRTGTLIALDRLIEEGRDKGSLNVFDCVDNMREQRVKMVQTFEQYMYIYKALVNALTFNCETIPVETFNEYVDTTNNNLYSVMFQQLRQSVETDSKADVDARMKNENLTDKNRLGADIPGSRFRAMLYLNRTDEESEYINAVYINSFVKRDYFIASQSPLPCTVADFLTMVYQEDCSCIATMEDLKDPGMTVGQYMPEDKKSLTVGNFKVSSSRLETKHSYVVRKLKIKYSGKFDSGEKIIYHFQYTKWMTGHDTPMNAKAFVQFVNEVNVYANELGEERSHVIVHCLKANERSGLFCAVATLMEKIKLERQVNVLNTLRHLRTRRQTAIVSMEQLKFCFQATNEYIKMNMLG